ncbi:hypothetical protein CCY99_00650 [Helicobacter sp. 16-1353]|uniref:flagellar FLiS export co-chaperone n=1 Tax=Helicobacter sp. 16-1353 TaxID=2004996 RepID=UPI000DCC8EC2|nr:flagellar FLiS export co-chaperone [Helicobacter sp. 16-1353]RAX55241.1 hypothetical protein CCY99_00650 [Helicobacter sp. 16-1353]
MSNDDILATLKKHLPEVEEESQVNLTKTQIHNFGENMKGINEFIGAAQTLVVNLNKIRNLAEKIQWIDDLLKQEENTSTIQILNTERQTHIANIKYMLENSKFMGVGLFDTELSCVINGKRFSLNIENPLHFIDDNMLEYCILKNDELNDLLLKVSQRLNGDDDNSSAVKEFDDLPSDILSDKLF